jgi:hypothetical protein
MNSDSSLLINMKAELQQKIANGYDVGKLPYIIQHIENLERKVKVTDKEMVLKMMRFYSARHMMVEEGYITLNTFFEEMLAMQKSDREKDENTNENKNAVWKEIVEDLSLHFDGPAVRYPHPIYNKVRFMSDYSTLDQIKKDKEEYQDALERGWIKPK